jgi:phenylalanyl-tRNA synthetase beta chain
MEFSEHWLRSMVDPDLSTEALSDLLTMSGLEVEDCTPVAPPLEGVVVAEVLSVTRHPDADRLNVCQVATGEPAPRTIVCGAPNVRAGMRVPCALPGARLPGDLTIKVAKVRGVESHGMLCSSRELGLSDDHGGLLDLGSEAPVGQAFADWEGLDDHRFLIKLTPNRADCLSVLGVAREVAALTGAALVPPSAPAVVPAHDRCHPFASSDPACSRFTGRVITGVNPKAPTPAWMRRRLERSGQRSISALVDVTNYVMLELGRPLHVYDLDRLQGAIDVRMGRAGEQLELLNGQTIEVGPDVLCICDERGPIGLAGIMGGESTKAGDDTVNVFLESAFFAPAAIAGRSRRFNFTSDAAHRFERGVDFDNNVVGIERATALILAICGGEAGPVVDQQGTLPARAPVRLRTERARKVIGVPIDDETMFDILARLGFGPRNEAPGLIAITPPSHRFDLSIEEDLIEEVARVWGFDRIPAEAPQAPAHMLPASETGRSLHALRSRLADAGYQEVINFSFVDADWEREFGATPAGAIPLLNPIASQLSTMRTSLIAGLVANLRFNLNRGATRARVFEIGRAFLRDEQAADGPLSVAGIRQPQRIAAAACGPLDEELWGNARRPVDFFDVKGDLEALCAPHRPRFVRDVHPALHPGRSARIEIDGQAVGWVGELHPRWVESWQLPLVPVVFEIDAEPLQRMPFPTLTEVSRFPALVRDVALLVDESLPAQTLLEALEAQFGESLSRISLFDLYRGPGIPAGKKSLAVRIVMQDTERTLTAAEADAACDRVVEWAGASFGAERR